jgi:hypothetical protein
MAWPFGGSGDFGLAAFRSISIFIPSQPCASVLHDSRAAIAPLGAATQCLARLDISAVERVGKLLHLHNLTVSSTPHPALSPLHRLNSAMHPDH